jgi:hypothetical protein
MPGEGALAGAAGATRAIGKGAAGIG